MNIGFGLYQGNVEDLSTKYQEVSCHVIFHFNKRENFCHKDQMVAVGHNTTTPYSLNYSAVVFRDNVNIALTVAVFNSLKAIACDIQNSYLNVKFREKI